MFLVPFFSMPQRNITTFNYSIQRSSKYKKGINYTFWSVVIDWHIPPQLQAPDGPISGHVTSPKCLQSHGYSWSIFVFFFAWTMGFHEWSCRILQKKPYDLSLIHLVRCWHFQKRILLMNLSPKYILGCRVSGAPSTLPAWGSLAESRFIQSTKTWCLCSAMKVNAKSTEIWSYCTFPPV